MVKIFMSLLVLYPQLTFAAGINGASLGLIWLVPFVGMLLSIALLPLILPHFWHRHQGKIAFLWAMIFIIACALHTNISITFASVLHALVEEYIPFIILLAALFVVAGGIAVKGNFVGTPLFNTTMLAMGTVCASIMGTTGAAMLFIRPIIRANLHRQYRVHTIVFFIFLVANAGGILTPLGDPPLFLGFLKGVDFFWMIEHVVPHTLFVWGALLAVYFCIDSFLYHLKKDQTTSVEPQTSLSFSIEGKWNFALLALIVGLVLMSGIWRSEIVFGLGDSHVALPDMVRDIGLMVIIGLSLWITPHQVRMDNAFSWAPMKEVAKLFIGIFVTMIPVMSMLKAGESGALSAVIQVVNLPSGMPDNHMYFWMTGVLSAFLDNAPTYLVFFNTASDSVTAMMTTLSSTLIAISLGAVFMGAFSYIGNAPNLMVKAIAEENNIKMPSFFGYMLWSVLCLLPVLVCMVWIFF